ncbi:MAG: hypothetical protein ABFD16_12990 [Thermoguttaceae bacterium]|jgi:hypothetical protein
MAENPRGVSQPSRRQFLVQSLSATGIAASAILPGGFGVAKAQGAEGEKPTGTKPVKAFCVDFNWGPRGAAPAGMYAAADPAEHVRWYQDLGANTIQTFCVSYNGYAWYPSEVAPVIPGLAHPDFLGEMVRRGHAAGMRVMGYFTLGANPVWEKQHPDEVHGADSDYIKIPMTRPYLDYFCRSVQDALKKTGIDGFMIDWVRPTQHQKWLECERQMYRELTGEAFPASGSPSPQATLRFDQLALERAWREIKAATTAVRPTILWTNHPFIAKEYPVWTGHRLLQEADWVLNEAPELEHLDWLRKQVGPKTLIVQNLCGWKGHDATMWKKLDTSVFGLYGFAKADPQTTLPSKEQAWNIKNIEILREAYHQL